MNDSQDERYKLARRRVKELKGFYSHLAAFVLVNLFLFAIDAADGGNWWFFYPLLGWGIGLGAHAANVFFFSKEWEERKIQELMGEKPKRKNVPDDYFENT